MSKGTFVTGNVAKAALISPQTLKSTKMKNLFKSMLPVAAIVFAMASCQPEETPEPDPVDTTTTQTPTAPPPPQPTVAGVHGAMIAVRLDFSYTQMGYTVPFNTEMGVAAFYNNPGDATMIDAGVVKINNNALVKATNSAYTVTAGIPTQEPTTLGLDGNINWNVSGNSGTGVQASNYNIDGTVYPFPNYTPTIPTDITRANGLVLNFTSATTSGADSVYVVIISGSQSIMRAYKANVGSVTISGDDLNALPASSTTSIAYIEICPWRYMGNQTLMGKTYAYVNERAIVRTINLN
jgi:hypothetical protein